MRGLFVVLKGLAGIGILPKATVEAPSWTLVLEADCDQRGSSTQVVPLHHLHIRGLRGRRSGSRTLEDHVRRH